MRSPGAPEPAPHAEWPPSRRRRPPPRSHPGTESSSATTCRRQRRVSGPAASPRPSGTAPGGAFRADKVPGDQELKAASGRLPRFRRPAGPRSWSPGRRDARLEQLATRSRGPAATGSSRTWRHGVVRWSMMSRLLRSTPASCSIPAEMPAHCHGCKPCSCSIRRRGRPRVRSARSSTVRYRPGCRPCPRTPPAVLARVRRTQRRKGKCGMAPVYGEPPAPPWPGFGSGSCRYALHNRKRTH